MWDCSGCLQIRSHMSYYIILSLVESKPFLFITMLEIEIVRLFIYMHYPSPFIAYILLASVPSLLSLSSYM